MNDHEIANQKIWGGKWKDPPIDQEFTEIIYCMECGNQWIDIGGYHWCVTCGAVWPGIETVYQCSLCLEEHEDEECNCYA